MSTPLEIPTPLDVPELAPSLGRLIVPRRQRDPWVPLDDIREELATALLELAGNGRAAASRDGTDAVLRITGRASWLPAWEQAVRRTAERVAHRVDREIELAARRVRMPKRRWKRLLLTAAERRAVAARLAASGGPFIAALDALGIAGDRVREASAVHREVHGAWQEALRTAARRVEAAWLALESQVEAERARWVPEIEDVALWRPSLWPVIAGWVPVAAALLWLGLVAGGYLPAPAWLATLLGF